MPAPPVLYIDAHLIVLDKPAGLAVHRGPQTPHSLESYLRELRVGFERMPQPAHRIDRDTSGCLVLGRHPKASKKLSALFEAARIGKVYWAAVEGTPSAADGRIDAPLLKVSTKADGWRIVVDPKGKPAATRWRVLDRRPGRTLIEFAPETGRTHQIRVHAAHLGLPLLGDPVYGHGHGPMQLHSRALTIPYKEDAPLTVTAPPPDAMRSLGFAFPDDIPTVFAG